MATSLRVTRKPASSSLHAKCMIMSAHSARKDEASLTESLINIILQIPHVVSATTHSDKESEEIPWRGVWVRLTRPRA